MLPRGGVDASTETRIAGGSHMTAERTRFASRVFVALLITLAVVAVVVLVVRFADLLLLLFAAILLAILIDAAATAVTRRAPLRRGWTVALVWVLLAVMVVGLGMVGGPRIADQVTRLSDRVTESITAIRAYLEDRRWGRWLLEEGRRFGSRLPAGSNVVGRVTRFFSTAVAWIAGAVVVVVLGVYLSAAPEVYTSNLLRLVPPKSRDRAEEVLAVLARSLRWWLIGRLTAMGLLGLLTAIGLLIAGVPLAATLGVLAAVTAFVPYLGPVLWLIPAALVAWADEPLKVVWVGVIYGTVQFLEGNLITPLVQQRAVSIPPAVLLAGQMFMGVFFGAMGVLVATPIAVVLIVLVQMLYVEDVLGEEVRLLGSHGQG
jgi:predicted PurR-regulated permease PerM